MTEPMRKMKTFSPFINKFPKGHIVKMIAFETTPRKSGSNKF